MKKLIVLILIAAVALVAWTLLSNPDASTEALLKSIAESEELKIWIEEHPAEVVASDAKDTLLKAFPFLEDLLNVDNWKQQLQTAGLDLIQEYMDSGDTEKAETLGKVITILCPDMAEEIDAVLTQDQ